MKLYIRTQEPGERREHVQYDHCFDVRSQAEWKARIDALGKSILTSVLVPDLAGRFRLQGRHLHTRSHKHETHYAHDTAINESYRQAAERLAASIEAAVGEARRCLVYLPLRGALPIWRAVRRYLRNPEQRFLEYHAVTSSFVSYPPELGMLGKHGGPAGGRYANILELRRLRDWCIGPLGVDHLLYVDEIISGGMMRGHVNEMMQLGVTRMLPVTVAAIADSFGSRSKANGYLRGLAEEREINAFLWEGCHTLISEDQKFLLGRHYVDHAYGPHVVPVLNGELGWFEEKAAFDRDVMGSVEEWA